MNKLHAKALLDELNNLDGTITFYNGNYSTDKTIDILGVIMNSEYFIEMGARKRKNGDYYSLCYTGKDCRYYTNVDAAEQLLECSRHDYAKIMGYNKTLKQIKDSLHSLIREFPMNKLHAEALLDALNTLDRNIVFDNSDYTNDKTTDVLGVIMDSDYFIKLGAECNEERNYRYLKFKTEDGNYCYNADAAEWLLECSWSSYDNIIGHDKSLEEIKEELCKLV